jgi:hypothetical protein
LPSIGEIPVAPFELAIVEEYQDKGNRNQNGNVHGAHPTYYYSVRLSQPCSNGVGLLLSRIKGHLEDSQMNLQLAVVLNRLGIAVLGRPPFLEEALGIITVV